MSLLQDLMKITNDRLRALTVYKIDLACEHCGELHDLQLECSNTCYPFDGLYDSADDPNRQVLLCPTCAKYHHEYWKDMWDEYRQSRL